MEQKDNNFENKDKINSTESSSKTTKSKRRIKTLTTLFHLNAYKTIHPSVP